MDPFVKAYIAWLESLHGRIKDAVAALPQEALDWAPGPEMNSIAVLAVHVAGAERYWIGDVAVQEPSGRDREAEFQTEGMDPAALGERLDRSLTYARATLSRLGAAALGESRTTPRHDRRFTVAWCLLHALEHTAQHTAHIELTRQLWEQQARHG